MSKRVYISADYAPENGDRDVVNLLHYWSENKLYKINFVDTAEVVSGSVSQNSDCRACDLKKEFNQQINASSSVIFIVGDKTSSRIAGSSCKRMETNYGDCQCAPYKQNTNGIKCCKYPYVYSTMPDSDIGEINEYSYIQHEFEQARRKRKNIIILYNSLRKEKQWIPYYMKDYENLAEPFWIYNEFGEKVGNYVFVKKTLGYE